MMDSQSRREARIQVGDFVRVASGPAYVKGQPLRGRVEEVIPNPQGAIVMVRVASGGLWGFRASHLAIAKESPRG